MTEDEGRDLAKIQKRGDPANEWRQDRANTFTNSFGITDESGKGIPGMHAEICVFKSPTLGHEKYRFSLMQAEFGSSRRAYQLEINLRPGLKESDKNYSHEHYGEPRFQAEKSWANAGFADALKLFCVKCNLTLDHDIPDYLEFSLK